MKPLIFAAILLLGTARSWAQQPRYTLDFQVSQTHFADTIGISWEQQQVYVPVTAGDRTLRFLLDTGASQAVVFADSNIEGCLPLGSMKAIDAIGVADTIAVVQLPPLTIGTTTFTGLRATVQQRGSARRNYDGILGFDLVNKGLNMKIDVCNGWLILTDQKHFFDGEGGFVTRYRLDYHTPTVEVTPFGRYTERVLFDTGSTQLYAMNKKSFDQGAVKCPDEAFEQTEGRCMGRHALGHYGTEPLGEVVFLALERLQWGGFSFADVHALTTQGGSHLGAPVLQYGTVAFNPKKKTVRFVPHEDGQTQCHVGNRQLQIAFVAENGLPTVGLVWPQGVPYRQGFRQGDVVLSIDNRAVESMAAFTARAYERGREYRFLLRSLQNQLHEARWVVLPDEQ